MSITVTSEQKQTLLWLIAGALLVAMLVLLGPVLTPFVAAAILSYVLNPGVDWLAARRLPRVLAVLIMMSVLVLLLLALVLVVLPTLRSELPLLQDRLPNLLDKIDSVLRPWLHQLGVNIHLDSAGIKDMMAKKLAAGSSEIGPAILASLKVGGTAVLGWIATLFLVPIVLFYLLMDWHALLERIAHTIPRRWVGLVTSMAQETDFLLAQYLRGQLLVMGLLALFYTIALTLAGFDAALPVGLITGLLVFIPYIGYGLGLLLAIVAAILQFEGGQGLVWIAIIYGLGQFIESFYLTPRLVGERIGLHPLTVIFALLAFGQLFGFVGVLLALPASAILSVVFGHVRRHYLNSRFYNQI
ncbi:MAG: AI-2E family transporter [Burkholderiaceae bacterium]|jgi:predicted PurR-regulated permease PerM